MGSPGAGQTRARRRIAAVDIGTNTTRSMVADVGRLADGRRTLDVVAEQRTMTRLGQGVDATGRLDPGRIAATVEAVVAAVAAAREVAAETVVAVATSAVRDAANGGELVDAVARRCEVTVEVMSGDREAAATFAGMTGLDLSPDRGELAGRLALADLGGGSTELVVAVDGAVAEARSLDIGSGRLTERHSGGGDPPGAEARAVLRMAAAEALADVPTARARAAFVTGGTASAVARLVGTPRLDASSLEVAMAVATSGPAAEVAARHELEAERVAILAAGIALLEAIRTWSGAEALVATRRGIREGVLLLAADALDGAP